MRHKGGENVNKTSKNELIERIEYILSYLLSRKYDRDIKIYFKKASEFDGNGDKTRDIGKEQILDRKA